MADPATYLEDPALTSAYGDYETATSDYVSHQQAASTLPYQLREAVQKKLDYNKDIIEQRNRAQGEYFEAPSAARVKYANIWDPQQRENLVARERSMAYQPWANLTDILNQRMGKVEDIIGAGTAAFQSAVAAAQGKAEMAQNRYTSLYQKAKDLADIEMEKIKAAKSGSGIGDMAGLFELVKEMMGLGKGVVPPGPTVPLTVAPIGTSPGLTYNAGPGGVFKFGNPRLLDPQGNVIEYSGYDDPDYIADKQKGFTDY